MRIFLSIMLAFIFNGFVSYSPSALGLSRPIPQDNISVGTIKKSL